MRPIKFRVWSEEAKEMIYFNLAHIFTLFKDSVQQTIMQFTGLKDKQGKDIYEGDICKDPSFSDIVQVKYGCDWGKKYGDDYWDAGFGLQGIHPFSNGRVKWSIDRLNTNYAKNIEVIGNIYENKDLLQ